MRKISPSEAPGACLRSNGTSRGRSPKHRSHVLLSNACEKGSRRGKPHNQSEVPVVFKSLRFVSQSSAPLRSASLRSVKLRSVWESCAPARFAPWRSAWRRSGLILGCAARHWSHASTPFFSRARCSSFAIAHTSSASHSAKRIM
jgi:hypothetical protein